MSKGLELLCGCLHGVYIPHIMAERLHNSGWTGITAHDILAIEKGPYGRDSDQYWQAWEDVLNDAEFTDEEGNVWRLHHDGDLWAYCEELMSDDEYYNFFGDYRE